MNRASRIVWIGILFLGAGTAAYAEDRQRVIIAGEFSVPLDSGWSWLREESKAWKVDDGTLQILALPGHVFAKYNDARNVLLRKAPETSKTLTVEVFVENQPKVLFEHAGLFWYYDDDTYISLFKEQMGKEVQVRMIREKEGAASFLFNKNYEGAGVWFRLVVSGGKATGYYRQTDKEEWQKMAQTDLVAKGEAKIGLNAAGGSKDTDRWARFREFRILEQAE